MKCLQCHKDAIESGEFYKNIPIRECEDGHRTALINIEEQTSGPFEKVA